MNLRMCGIQSEASSVRGQPADQYRHGNPLKYKRKFLCSILTSIPISIQAPIQISQICGQLRITPLLA